MEEGGDMLGEGGGHIGGGGDILEERREGGNMTRGCEVRGRGGTERNDQTLSGTGEGGPVSTIT